LEHRPLEGFVPAGALSDAEIVQLGKIKCQQGNRFGNIGKDNIADRGDILVLAMSNQIELDQTIGHHVAERLPGEKDPSFGSDQALGQIPRQIAASAGKPA
jgi:hypothetical protein